MSGERAEDRHQTRTQPFDGAAVERLIVRLPERYRPVRLLGHGGQGMVWLAEDRELGEQVAIKILARLDGVAAERVRREVRLCRRLRHANLAEVYELVEAGDNLAVVMEHLPGGALTARLVPGPLAVAEIVGIAHALLAGLAHLHDAGIVHRDVKPSNVLFAADGTAKLADFGLLRPLAGDGDITRTGLTVGTPAYMSPEQIRGDELTAASDLYSLGATLYELLVGRQPFVAISSLEVAHLHLSRHPDSIRAARADCPRWLAAFVERLLAKDPRRRWRDAHAALAAFDRRRPGFSRRTKRGLAAAAGAAAILAVAVAAIDRMRDRDVAEARVEGDAIVARTASGRELWRSTPHADAVMVALGDVLPARGTEVVTGEMKVDAGIASTTLVVRGRDGRELRREPVTHEATHTVFGRFTDSYAARIPPLLADVDGDGGTDVLLPVNHWPYYPAMVMRWQPASSRGVQPVLVNSGHVTDVRVADVGGTPAPELVVVGFNNPLGFQSFVAVLSLGAAPVDANDAGAMSPDLAQVTGAGTETSTGLLAYTLLGEARGGARIEAAGRDGIRLRLGDSLIRADGAANPEGSAFWGKGGEPRRHLWEDAHAAKLEVVRSPEQAVAVVASFLDHHAAAVSEVGMLDAVLLLFARALADADQPERGAEVLARAERGQQTNRRVYRQRGELLLIAGRNEAGVRLVERAISAVGLGAHPLDELTILALAGAASGDDALTERALRVWQHGVETLGEQDGTSRRPVVAFLAGRWRDATPGGAPWRDEAVHWQALAQWAALEAGAAPGQALAALAPIASRPEARDLCRLVTARAAMLGGDSRTAADLALQVLISIRPRARLSYEEFLWEGLAHWLRGAALQDAGATAAARADLEVAASRMPGSWFGRDARARLGAGGVPGAKRPAS